MCDSGNEQNPRAHPVHGWAARAENSLGLPWDFSDPDVIQTADVPQCFLWKISFT